MNAAVAGVGPNMKGAVPWRRASSAQTSAVVGSKAACAPSSSGEVEAGRTEVDGHDPVVAPVDEGRDRGEADRSAAEDAHTVARLHVGLLRGVHADGERLGERGDVEGQIVGHRMQPARGRPR